MNIHPITTKAPACFGVCCPDHGKCARYAAVNGAPASLPRIGFCETGEDGARVLFLAIEGAV